MEIMIQGSSVIHISPCICPFSNPTKTMMSPGEQEANKEVNHKTLADHRTLQFQLLLEAQVEERKKKKNKIRLFAKKTGIVTINIPD